MHEHFKGCPDIATAPPNKNNKRQLHTALGNHNEPDVMGIESRRWPDFRHPFRSALGLTQPPTQWVLCSSLGQIGQGVVMTTKPSPSAKVKERVQVYLYPPSRLSWPVLRWTLLYFPALRNLYSHSSECKVYGHLKWVCDTKYYASTLWNVIPCSVVERTQMLWMKQMPPSSG